VTTMDKKQLANLIHEYNLACHEYNLGLSTGRLQEMAVPPLLSVE
jgi:hypothetical protein